MKTLSAFIIGLMACLAIGISTARGQVVYTLEDLGVVEKMDASVPAAINSQGYVAGTAYKGTETCAFHYDYFKKFMEDAGGVNSRGFGINSMNLVVGDAFFANPMEPRSHAAIFKSGAAVDIGVLPGQVYGRANGINSLGQVVGYSGPQRDSAQSRAFVWTSTTGMTDIGTLNGGTYAQANAINDLGYVTGASQKGIGPMVTTHAFLYRLPTPPFTRYNQMVDLGVLGGLSSYGMAINSSNHVVGYSTVAFNDERVHGFLHDGIKMIDLGSLGGPGNQWGTDFSVALGVNKQDQVVGYTYLPAVGEMPIQQVGFLWRRGWNGSGQMINLNKLLYGKGKNYLVFSATAINDNGQIVGAAYNLSTGSVRAVLLTPSGPVIQ